MPVKPFWTCHFCGKRRDEVKLLIAGPDAISICDECVLICFKIVNDFIEELKKENKKKEDKDA